MATVIPRIIGDSEIIIRFAFKGDYKRKKPLLPEHINDREVFFDNRFKYNEVSILRKFFESSERCIQIGESIQQNLTSLIIFRKSDFDSAIEKNLKVRADFQADIIGSPLDEQGNYIDVEIEVSTDTPGNPAHGDIRIINPGLIEADAENANTALRSFSSTLFKQCKIITLSVSIDLTDEIFENTLSET